MTITLLESVMNNKQKTSNYFIPIHSPAHRPNAMFEWDDRVFEYSHEGA